MTIHEDVIARIEAARHRHSCANCEDGFCYDWISLEMTDAEHHLDTAPEEIQRLASSNGGATSTS
jgi:hypothetical protein